jgi:hypothetical protein
MAAASARLAAALVALALVAASCFAGDGSGARAAVGQATGPLVATAPGDAAVLVARNLAPGGARAGEVTVTNVGDSSGTFALSASGLVDTAAPLSDVLDLSVDDVTSGSAIAPIYSGRLDALSAVALGTLQQGEARRYRMTVSFPSGRPDAVDDVYQGASTAVTFVWATSSTEPAPPANDSSESATPDTRTPAISVDSTSAGSNRARGATLTASARQKGSAGVVVAWVTCRASCRWSLGGIASRGATHVRLRTVRGTLRRTGRVRVALPLPHALRAALAARRRVTVRLRLRATVGGRVVAVRRTVRVVAPKSR